MIATAAAPPSPPASTDLPRLTKEVIVLTTTLLQGVGIYWLQEGAVPSPALRLVALSLLVALPGFFVLCVRQLGDGLLWRGMAWVAALLMALHGCVWWMLGSGQSDHTQWRFSSWVPWLLCQGALLFVALAWMQTLLQQRSLRRTPYAVLFEHAWNNAMVLGFALQFVALGWAVLGLWAGLFALLKVEFFTDTFTQSAFACTATGLMAGLGIVLARGQPRPLKLMLQLLLALYRLLLPLLALVVVLFVAFVPFNGVQALWQTRKAAPLLMGVQLCLLVFVNAVYQDGQRPQPPYALPLRALIAAALALMPVLAGLAMWAVALRVQQYGWTHGRVWAAASAGVLMLYALGYAWAALERDAQAWLQRIGRINPCMSWLVLALLVLLHTPLIDPYRIGAASQYQRLAQGQQPPTLHALQDLRFDHGRHGRVALQRLQALPAFAQGQVAQDVQRVLQADTKQYLPWRAGALVQQLRSLVAVAPGHAQPPEQWWLALEQDRRNLEWRAACRSDSAGVSSLPIDEVPNAQTARCLVLQARLDSTSAHEQQLLCALSSYRQECFVFGVDAQGQWRHVAQLQWHSDNAMQQEHAAQVQQALRAGVVQVQPSRWQELRLPGLEVEAAPVGQVHPLRR